MRFNLLGPLEIVTDDQRVLVLGTSKTAQVLALLLARRSEITSVETLIGELWEEKPPRSALTTLQTYVYHARQMFARERLAAEGRQILVTRSPGYAVQVMEDEVDASIFARLVRTGQSALEEGHPEVALVRLQQALDLWRGPAFGNITTGHALNAEAAYLDELRITALDLRMEAGRQLGRHRELVPQLRSLVVSYPFNESFHGQLIDALYRSGRRAEALQAYQRLRSILRTELGVEPTVELQRLHREVLGHRDPAGAGTGAGAGGSARIGPVGAVAAGLPAQRVPARRAPAVAAPGGRVVRAR